MELRYFDGNPAFPFEGKEGGVQSVWEMTLVRGETVAPHSHPTGIELYVVIDGMGEMQVGKEQNTILAGDVIFIPPGADHSASNPSDQPLHVVGVLWEPTPQAELAGDAFEQASEIGRIGAGAALSHIERLTSFAQTVKQKMLAAGMEPAENAQRIAEVEETIMKSIGKIWADYSGRV